MELAPVAQRYGPAASDPVVADPIAGGVDLGLARPSLHPGFVGHQGRAPAHGVVRPLGVVVVHEAVELAHELLFGGGRFLLVEVFLHGLVEALDPGVRSVRSVPGVVRCRAPSKEGEHDADKQRAHTELARWNPDRDLTEVTPTCLRSRARVEVGEFDRRK